MNLLAEVITVIAVIIAAVPMPTINTLLIIIPDNNLL